MLNSEIRLIIFCSRRWRSYTVSKNRTRSWCGSDHELLIAKFRLKLKKVGKTIRSLRYDLNQILYDYTVEVRNRFKGRDLIDRVPDELWMEVRDIVQETGIKTIPMEKNCEKQTNKQKTYNNTSSKSTSKSSRWQLLVIYLESSFWEEPKRGWLLNMYNFNICVTFF